MTVYLTSTNDTLLTTARQLIDTAPASRTTAVSGNFAKSATGWSELYSQGGNATLGGSEPTPSGHGFIWDTTFLEAKAILSGTWTPSVELSAASTGFVADVYVRLYRRDSGGTYHQLTVGGVATKILVASAVSIGTTLTTYTASTPPTFDLTPFTTGDKLYLDVVLNITTGNSNNQANNRNISLGENGGAADSSTMPAVGPSISGSAAATSSIVCALPVWPPLQTSVPTSSTSATFFVATPAKNFTAIGATPLSMGTTIMGATIGIQPVTLSLMGSQGTSTTANKFTALAILSPAASSSSTSVSSLITAKTQIPLGASTSTSADNMGFTPTYVNLDPATSTTSDGLLLTAIPEFRFVGNSTTSDSLVFASPIPGVDLIQLDIPSSHSTSGVSGLSAPTQVPMDTSGSASSVIVAIWNGAVALDPSNGSSSNFITIGPWVVRGAASSTSSDFIVFGTLIPEVFSFKAISKSSSKIAVGYLVVGPSSIYQLQPGISLSSLKGATTTYGPFGQTFDVYDWLSRPGAGNPPQIVVAKYSHQDYGLMSFPTLLKKIQ